MKKKQDAICNNTTCASSMRGHALNYECSQGSKPVVLIIAHVGTHDMAELILGSVAICP